MGKCNGRNDSSVSQLVKTRQLVSKPVCSSNASKPIICNFTCKPGSNFVSACQSVKPARKLTDMYRKRPPERSVNKKSSRQHGFTTCHEYFDGVRIFL